MGIQKMHHPIICGSSRQQLLTGRLTQWDVVRFFNKSQLPMNIVNTVPHKTAKTLKY